MRSFIIDEIEKLKLLTEQLLDDKSLLAKVEHISNLCIETLLNGNKILFAGNGGSAADSQHLAAELVSRLRYDRPGLPAIAITTDTSALTAIGNDYGYEYVFSRQVESIGKAGDLFIAISTSGKSPNIINALKAARKSSITTIGFTGAHGNNMEEVCNVILNVPSIETPKIQECHILLGHIICALIEEKIHGAKYNPQQLKETTDNH